MKFSGKMMLMILAMVSTTVLLNAQSKGDTEKKATLEERIAKKTARLQSDLGLDDKQTEEINAISLAYAEKSKAVREATHSRKESGEEVDKKAVHQQIKEIRDVQTTEIKAVLTAEQAVKFDAILKEKKGKKGGKHKSRNAEEHAAKKTAHLQKDLGLNDTQTKKIGVINLAYAKKSKAIHEAARTEKEAGKEIDKDAIRQEMKTMRETQIAEIKTVLTEVQITKFDALIKAHKADKKGKKGKHDKSKKGE